MTMSQGPNNAGRTEDIATGGFAWVNPDNVSACDGIDATSGCVVGVDSNALQVTQFGFSVPTLATVIGVSVSVTRDSTLNTAFDKIVQLMLNNVLIGVNKADLVTLWPVAPASVAYGGSADVWGAALTPAIVNNTKFGVRIIVQSASAIPDMPEIDCVIITVYYTMPKYKNDDLEPFPA